MEDYSFTTLDPELIAKCHKLNEKNVPNVGSQSLDGFISLVKNSDYNECVLFKNKVVGFVICFQDNESTKLYMNEIKHKNFKEISNRVKNFLYIDRIAVDAQYRSIKLGTALYKNVHKFAKLNLIEHLTAEINLLPSVNKVSFNFHESFGFENIANVKYSEDYEVSLQKMIIGS